MTCHCQDIATKDGKPRGIVGSTARGEVKQASMDHGRAAGEPLFGPSSVSGRLQAATNTTQQHRQFRECDITDSTVPGVDIRCLCHAFATNTAEIPLFCFGSSPLIAPKKPRRGALNRQNLDSASSTRLSGQTRHRASHGSQHALHRRIEKRASASAPIFQVSTTESTASDVAALGPRLQSQYTGTAAFVLCRSGAESFQPGRRPRTPESRDPDGRRATEGSAVSRFQSRRGQTRARLKTEKTVAVPRSTVWSRSPVQPNATVNMHAMATDTSIQQVTAGRRRGQPNADGLDSWTKSLDPAVVPSISTWASAVCERLRTSPIFQYRRGVRMAAHIGSRVRGVSRANGRRPDVERALTSAKDACWRRLEPT